MRSTKVAPDHRPHHKSCCSLDLLPLRRLGTCFFLSSHLILCRFDLGVDFPFWVGRSVVLTGRGRWPFLEERRSQHQQQQQQQHRDTTTTTTTTNNIRQLRSTRPE